MHTNLCLRGQVSIDVVDLLLKPFVEHLVCLVEDQHLDAPCPQRPTPDHVEDAAWRAGNHVLAVVQLPDVLAQVRAADARVALHVHVVSQGQHHLLNLDCQLSCGREH